SSKMPTSGSAETVGAPNAVVNGTISSIIVTAVNQPVRMRLRLTARSGGACGGRVLRFLVPRAGAVAFIAIFPHSPVSTDPDATFSLGGAGPAGRSLRTSGDHITRGFRVRATRG